MSRKPLPKLADGASCGEFGLWCAETADCLESGYLGDAYYREWSEAHEFAFLHFPALLHLLEPEPVTYGTEPLPQVPRMLRAVAAEIQGKPADLPTPEPGFAWHTATAAADIVGVVPKTISNWIRDHELQTFGERGTSYLFSLEELESKRQAVAERKRRTGRSGSKTRH